MHPVDASPRFPAPAWADWWQGHLPRDASDLGRIAASSPEPQRRLRLAVVRNFTLEPLGPFLRTAARLLDLDLECAFAPPGLLHEAVAAGGDLWTARPDALLIALHPGELVRTDDDTAPDQLRDLLEGMLRSLRTHWRGPVLVGWLPDPDLPARITELRAGDVASVGRGLPGACLLDWEATLAEVGRRRCFDSRLWDGVHYPFTAEGAAAIARDIASALAAGLERPVKCVVVDADDTLWGGLAGEEGLEGIVLSGARGAPYRALQRRLLALKRRGMLLALATKNNPEDVHRILDQHPAMLLRRADFAAIRAHWEPKPESLRSIAAELGFGLDTLLFLDDSPFERAAVAEELPGVRVPDLPDAPSARPAYLDALPALQPKPATPEDRLRAADVEAGADREAHRRNAATHESYLASLGITMRVRIDRPSDVARIAQLCGRTNQFNCTSRRHAEPEIAARIAADDWLVAAFSLADRFGDQGLTGAALVRLEGTTARFETLLVSCRVFGRRAEHAFLSELTGALARRGFTRFLVEFAPSDRNRIAHDFLESVAVPIEGSPGLFELHTPPAGLGQPHIRILDPESGSATARP